MFKFTAFSFLDVGTTQWQAVNIFILFSFILSSVNFQEAGGLNSYVNNSYAFIIGQYKYINH